MIKRYSTDDMTRIWSDQNKFNTWKIVELAVVQIMSDRGIVPKKCQKCSKSLTSVITEIPIVQKVPFYKCKKCKYVNASGDNALWHEHENKGHNVVVETKIRTIEFKRIIPETPYIKETSKDVIILCHQCHVKKS